MSYISDMKELTKEQRKLIVDMYLWDNQEWQSYLKDNTLIERGNIFTYHFYLHLNTNSYLVPKETLTNLKIIRDEYVRFKKLNS